MKKNNSFLLSHAISDYFHIITSTPSRSDALKNIADKATSDFGEYITPGNFRITDEILINLIELIDQIIYEFKDNTDNDPHIKDYIIDDLYSKFSLTLEALDNPDRYLFNIRNRSLYPDDIIIIKNKHISEIVPLLISELEGITNLQKEILKTLLYFPDENCIDLYYNTFKNSTSGFVKSVSLLGLKYKTGKGLDWNTVKEINGGTKSIVRFAEEFDTDKIHLNSFPSSKEELTFTILHIEKNIATMTDHDSINWIFQMLLSIPSFNFENSWLCEINTSISNILLAIDLKTLKNVLNNEQVLIKTMKFIDLLPGKIFNRLTGRFDELGFDFLSSLNSAIEKKKVVITSDNSNILNYICWNSTETF
jgi:hypothetical protein